MPEDPRERETKHWTGPWDDTILCHECESRFNKYDQVGVEALRRQPVSVPGSSEVGELPDTHAGSLKLYFMHALWRACESGHEQMAHVTPDAVLRLTRLRELLLRDDPGEENDFPVILVRYDPHSELGDGLIGMAEVCVWKPTQGRLIAFQLGLWRVSITVSAGGVPPLFRQLAIVPGLPVRVGLGGDLLNSATVRRALSVASARGWATRKF